jgi:hypothetical protein
MRIALMQPYFVPYLGYFQLMGSVDLFVLHDDVEYSKGGWINRNRILLEGEPRFLTVPLQRSSDYALISERRISESYDGKKVMRLLDAAYCQAPHWKDLRTSILDIVHASTRSLLEFNTAGLGCVRDLLGLTTPVVLASDILPDATSSGQRKVIEVCRALGATEYVNAQGGMGLYSADEFLQSGIRLGFLRSRLSPYSQGVGKQFVPALSVLDALAWIGRDGASRLVESDYDIIFE